MRKTISVSVLLLALCAPVFAGDIPTPLSPEPPPRSAAAGETAADGVIPNPSLAEEVAAETMLGLIESVLALL